MLKSIIVLPDGTRLASGPDEVNAIKSVTLTESVNSGEDMTLGSCCASILEATIFAPRGGLTLMAGDKVTLYKVDGSGEETKKGVFILEKPTRASANAVKITGYDRIIELDKDLTSWLNSLNNWPYNLLEFARMVCTVCGLSLVNADIPNADFPVPQFQCSDVTGRELMKWIGEICGCFCRSNADGNIELAWYTPSGKTITPSGEYRYFPKGLSYETYEVAAIEAVQIKLADSDAGALWPDADQGDNTYVISGNPILLADVSPDLQVYLDVVQERLAALRYTPCRVSTPANLDINAGHTLEIVDSNGVSITACVMTKTSSGQKDTLECTGSYRRDSVVMQNNKSPTEKIRQIELALKSVDGKRVVSMINLSEDGVKIQGEKIQLEGTVTANENFKILIDGSIEAKAGKIGGCVIEDGKLIVPAAHIKGPLAIGQLPEEAAQKSDIPTVPTDISSFTNDAGYQTESGVVSIVNGRVTADYVSALGVTASRLVVKTSSGSTLLSAGDNQVQIAGWNVDSNSLYSGNSFSNAECFICTGSTGKMSIGGSEEISGWVLKAGNNFGVTKTGDCYLNAVHISGGSVKVPTYFGVTGVLAGYATIDWQGVGCTDIGVFETKVGSATRIVPNGIKYESGDPYRGGQIITVQDAPLEEIECYLNGTWYVEALGSTAPVTSDRNAKYGIKSQSDVYSQLFDKLQPVTYKYKNGTSGRTHTGFIAQDVESAILSLGLTTQEFAGICYHLDENGNRVKYGIRYEEIVSLNTYEIQKLKQRVAKLEAKIEA
ncbi:MAG: tail fiber domain-containing protein [Oscillospiraceae bacterium]|nr:tail fiber domain-containing protein [Oscillospiraceae bacterium]MBQ6852370.1 tail fiber domain-containing protein [Oscillospiraceae bacterium]